jgi:ketosteroid isomerase-like protein
MKKFDLLVLTILSILIHGPSVAQQSEEALIRSLENEEREAILKGDTTMLYRLMSSQIVVHNPENTIVNFKQFMQRIKSGKINYGTFERQIEKITFIGDAAIVMGKELLIPKGATQNANKTVTRRFTNFWMKENDVWKLSARQATIISIN